MYKVKTTNNIYESIGYDYPGEEALKLMSDDEKKEVYLEGVIKMTHAINILNCCKMDSKRTFLLWTLIAFKNNFIVFLNELGMTTLEIEERLKLEREKNKVKQK
jgi:hypothetical protein